MNAKKMPRAPVVLLILLALAGAACEGFFVDPALTSVVVTPPTPSLMEGSTLQMIATGSYADGTTKTITGNATWSTSDLSIATVTSAGVVSAIAPGSTTISASSGAVSGSTNVTVMLAGLQSIQVTPTTASISSGQTQQFQAMGRLQNGQQENITNAVTWKSSASSVATIDATGLATAQTVTGPSTTQITAVSGNVVSNIATLGVTP
ncbi:MAG TPA: Ig-like domain-containing protein [Terriglobales bacterium]|nr:Ig-like domain-containing protein [Terriglobales bacterium]